MTISLKIGMVIKGTLRDADLHVCLKQDLQEMGIEANIVKWNVIFNSLEDKNLFILLGKVQYAYTKPGGQKVYTYIGE